MPFVQEVDELVNTMTVNGSGVPRNFFRGGFNKFS